MRLAHPWQPKGIQIRQGQMGKGGRGRGRGTHPVEDGIKSMKGEARGKGKLPKISCHLLQCRLQKHSITFPVDVLNRCQQLRSGAPLWGDQRLHSLLTGMEVCFISRRSGNSEYPSQPYPETFHRNSLGLGFESQESFPGIGFIFLLDLGGICFRELRCGNEMEASNSLSNRFIGGTIRDRSETREEDSKETEGIKIRLWRTMTSPQGAGADMVYSMRHQSCALQIVSRV